MCCSDIEGTVFETFFFIGFSSTQSLPGQLCDPAFILHSPQEMQQAFLAARTPILILTLYGV